MGEESATNRRDVLKLMAGTAMLSSGSVTVAGKPPSTPSAQNDIPQILPTPQRVEKRGKGFPVTPVVTLVAGASVDTAALHEIKTILQSAGVRKIRHSDGSDHPRGPLTIFLGEPATNPWIGRALEQLNVDFPGDIPAEGYVLATGHARGGKQVVLAGTDNTGTFHATQTLRQLIVEHSGRPRLPGVVITDYPDMPIRGAIEGFYGPPWSHEDRLRQLEFYGNVKNNTYIYAPKDDPYHREKWREPYPPDELAKLKELVDRAQRNHVDVTFALSPGVSICYSRESDYQALIDKFETMYDIGVRSFSIPFDDISYTDWNCEQDRERFGPPSPETAAEAQVYLLNRVQRDFIETHEGITRLQMVPTEYGDLADTAYKRVIRKELDEDVIVMWTGTAVVPSEITTEQAEKAKELFEHDILLWDNYPVNDYDRHHLLVGPVTGRETDLSQHGVIGLTSNPMNEAEASKIPLSTIANFTWNDNAYDPKQSWKLSLRRFSDDAHEELHTFAENTRATPLYQSLSESPELSQLIDGFWQAYESGNFDPEREALTTEFAAIEQTPATLRACLNNVNFLDEVEPWLEKTELYGTAGQAAVAMLVAQEAGNDEEAWRQRRVLVELSEQIAENPKHYTRAMLSASPLKHAPSIVNEFIEQSLAENNRWLDTESPTNLALDGTATQSSDLFFSGGYPFPASNAIDGDLFNISHTKFEEQPWWQVNLGAINFINTINIWNRTSCCADRVSDYYVLVSDKPFGSDSLEEALKQPGIWSSYQEETAGRPTEIEVYRTGRYIRIWLTDSTALNMAEVEAIGRPTEEVLTVSGAPPATDASRLILAADSGADTPYTAARVPKPNETLVVSAEKVQPLNKVTVLQSIERPVTADIQVRTIDDSWKTIGELDDSYTLIDANKIRTDSVRLVWTDDSAAPVIYELIPHFDNS